MPSSASGTPKQIASTAPIRVEGGVLLAGKNSGLFDTTSKVGCATAMAMSPSNVAPRSNVTSCRFQTPITAADIDRNFVTTVRGGGIRYKTAGMNRTKASPKNANGENRTRSE